MQEQENMEQNTPDQNPSFNPNQPVHHSVWIPIVVIAGLVVGYLALAGANDWWPFENQSQESRVSSQEEQTDNDIADWQTYRNDEYGFEVRYPRDWSLDMSLAPGYYQINKNDLKVLIEPSVSSGPNYGTPKNESTIEISGKSAKRIDYLTENKDIFFSHIIFDDNFSIRLSAADQKQLISQSIGEGLGQKMIGPVYDFELMEQILSTFRFIEPANTTSNWQTYRNDEFGFEVRYPQNWEIIPDARAEARLASKERIKRNLENTKNCSDTDPQTICEPGALGEDLIIDFHRGKSSIPIGQSRVINGIDWNRTVEDGLYTIVRFNIEHNGNEIIFSAPDFNEQILLQILSTFKFIGSDDETANWKTYTNTQYGFEFKYPASWYIDSSQYPINLSNYQNANSFNLGNKPADLENIFVGYTDDVGPMFKLDDLKQSLNNYQELVKFETIISNSGSEGRIMVIYSSDEPTGNHTSATFFRSGSQNSWTVTFSLGTNSEDQANLLNQILSTFKFIN